MRVIALTVLIAGIVLFGYGDGLEAYENESVYWQRLAEMTYGDDVAFVELQASSLTPKYRLQDYGVVLMAVGVIGIVVVRRGTVTLKSPSSKWGLILLAVALPVVTIGGVAFDITQAANRGEYPPWGDAIMIALLGLPLFFVPLLVWSLFHLAMFWPREKQQPAPLGLALSRQSNWWLLVVSVITTGLTVYYVVLGDWWMVLPGVGWLYYYLSLAADRKARRLMVRRTA